MPRHDRFTVRPTRSARRREQAKQLVARAEWLERKELARKRRRSALADQAVNHLMKLTPVAPTESVQNVRVPMACIDRGTVSTDGHRCRPCHRAWYAKKDAA